MRGTAKVTRNGRDVYLLSAGEVGGELSSLTGNLNSANVVAESPVTALWIKEQHLLPIIEASEGLQQTLWQIAASRIAHNLLAEVEPFAGMDPDRLRVLLQGATLTNPNGLAKLPQSNHLWVLVAGTAGTLKAPAVLPSSQLEFSNARIFAVPMPE